MVVMNEIEKRSESLLKNDFELHLQMRFVNVKFCTLFNKYVLIRLIRRFKL